MASRSNSGTKPGKQTTSATKTGANLGSTSNLDRTLKDLESAFADWESLSSAKPRAASDSMPRKAAAQSAAPQDDELRKKTKKLLKNLRRQLADLT